MLRTSWDRVEHLNEAVSPISFLFVGVTAVPTLLVMLSPSPIEIGLWVGAEFIGGLLFACWDPAVFLRFMPESRLFFPGLSPAVERLESDDERLELFNALVAYPRTRTTYAWLAAWPKLMPVYIVMVCLWHYPHPWYVQLFSVLAWSLMNCVTFNSLIFFESHDYVSRLIARLHGLQDWTAVFKLARWVESEREFGTHELILLIASLANVFLAQAMLLLTRPHDSRVLPGMALVSLVGLLSAGRVWYVSRRLHSEALWNIFAALDGRKPRTDHGTLPLHSVRLLGRFEQTVNALAARVREHERELSRWVTSRTEEERFLALAEFSALVVHDLSSPLQSVRLDVDQLETARSKLRHPECLDRIQLNSSRTLELVQSLRAYLRAPVSADRTARVDAVLGDVMRALATRFSQTEIQRLQYHVDEALSGVRLEISTAELIHVLTNVIGNALENMFARRAVSTSLSVTLVRANDKRALISIRDSGSGLSPERFEDLTGFTLLAPRPTGEPRSLGLRLVRRLVERQGGTLSVLPQPPGEPGTEFRLELPRAP